MQQKSLGLIETQGLAAGIEAADAAGDAQAASEAAETAAEFIEAEDKQ